MKSSSSLRFALSDGANLPVMATHDSIGAATLADAALAATAASTMPANHEDICGLPVLTVSIEALSGQIERQISSGGPAAYLACLNPHSHFLTLGELPFRQALQRAEWLVPDGVGIVLASRLTGGRIRTRITGADVFQRASEMLEARGGMRVFFLGSTTETLEKIQGRMQIDYPNVTVAGVYSPPFAERFSEADNRAMIAAINGAKPDVLWVGMTAPKQEIWLHEHIGELHVRFAAAIGAVFDFYSGNVPRAPAMLQRLGAEWLLRLMQQPRRLWRRTFVSAPLFLLHLLAHKVEPATARTKGAQSGVAAPIPLEQPP
jgi:N-acetylglucosaminyldiphosphoundecaprenol N-acetyl-beta-D-mannosaminyltransferase